MTTLHATAPDTPVSGAPGVTPGAVTGLWAEAQFAALGVGEAPEYGSTAWLRLRADDPRRAAAIIFAAEMWRRHRAREAWLDQLIDDDPERWFAIVTEDADAQARKAAHVLARQPTAAEVAARRAQFAPSHTLKATPGWSPIAIPGQPGRYLVYDQENAA